MKDKNKTLLLFLIDNSGSMSGDRIMNLEKVFNRFHNDIKNIEIKFELAMAYILFSDHIINQAKITTVAESSLPKMEALGGTSISKAIAKGCDIYEDWEDRDYSNVVMILITDGEIDEFDIQLPHSFNTIFKGGKNDFYAFVIKNSNVKNLKNISPIKDNTYLISESELESLFDNILKSIQEGSLIIKVERKRKIQIGYFLVFLLINIALYFVFNYKPEMVEKKEISISKETQDFNAISQVELDLLYENDKNLLRTNRKAIKIAIDKKEVPLKSFLNYYNLKSESQKVVFSLLKEFNKTQLLKLTKEKSHLKELEYDFMIKSDTFVLPSLEVLLLKELEGSDLVEKQKKGQIKITRIKE